MKINGDSRLAKCERNKKRYKPAKGLAYLGQRLTRKERDKRIAKVVKGARG